MLIDGTVSIKMLGGIIPHGDSGSAILTMNPVVLLDLNPNLKSEGKLFLNGGLSIAPQANVIHSGEVDINPPTP
jgi:hypothetical protein